MANNYYWFIIILSCFLIYSHLTASESTAASDDIFYIIIDAINIYTCRGVTNQIQLNEDDVNIVNEKGNRVYYIKAPGNYTLHFKKIQVEDNFGYLTGEIGVTLQVPIFEGPAGIRFDLPYTMIPETGLLNQECDEHSGIVERNNRQYCRYCDMCQLSNQIETGLNRGRHKYLPELATGQEDPFSASCDKISANVYDFKRTINLPGKSELEKRAKEKIQGVDGEIRKRLNKGRGRFQVFLNLISSERPPIPQRDWFQGSQQCRCCSPTAATDISCRVLSFLYCNREDCKSAWAQQCLHNSAKIVACYTVEFNYRMTSNFQDVQTFLRQNGFPNQERPAAKSSVSSIRSSSSALFPSRTMILPSDADDGKDDSHISSMIQQPEPSIESPIRIPASLSTSIITPTKPISSSSSSSNEQLVGNVKSLSEQCTAVMPPRLTHLRRYCTIFWNAKLCCSHCETVC